MVIGCGEKIKNKVIKKMSVWENANERINEILQLEVGWDGEEAEKILPQCADLARKVLCGVRHTTPPKIFPVQDGRVDAEFTGEVWMTFGEEETIFHYPNENNKIVREVISYASIKEDTSTILIPILLNILSRNIPV